MKTAFRLFAFIFLVSFVACTKDPDNNSGTKNLTKTQILLKKPWIVQEVRALENNNLSIYERGGTITGVNYNNEVLTFKDSASGTLKDIFGVTSNFDWKFRNVEQTKMLLVIHYTSGDANLEYNMVNISENNFTATLNYQTKGINVLASVRRSWKP